MFSLKIKIKYNILLNIQDHVFVFVCGNVNVYETKKYLERTYDTYAFGRNAFKYAAQILFYHHLIAVLNQYYNDKERHGADDKSYIDTTTYKHL